MGGPGENGWENLIIKCIARGFKSLAMHFDLLRSESYS